MVTTHDISEFGQIELDEATKLLKQYKKNKHLLNNGVMLAYDTASGYVYLIDIDENRAMLNPLTKKIEPFVRCPECETEGFIDELKEENDCCKKFIKKIEGI